MEYITSRGYELPSDKDEMENADWFNMWRNRNFPYTELLSGDTLYWFDTINQKLVWKTEVVSVDRYPYADKKKIFHRFKKSLGHEYYESRPTKGYFVGYKIKVVKKIDIDKPKGFKFPQLGWLRVDNSVSNLWFNRNPFDDNQTLDNYISSNNKSIIEQLAEINKQMQNVSPERINKLVSVTIRKDTKMINALKLATNFKCQFPNCRQQIKKKNGGFYIEVAHIKPVSKGGQSILGNLLVLCPNHHKEFDFGDLHITEQTNNKVKGQLNKNHFDIDVANYG
ncbi:MAG: HNH endonuclease [Bacteroidetes bacterium]|nr:HNH endonuclease [Bacteroidota bacterium]